MSELNDVFKFIDEHFDEHIQKIQSYLRQPSVSGEGIGMHECAELTAKYIENLGGEAEVISSPIKYAEHPGWPLVYGWLDSGADKTLLVYGMYDTQPVEEEKWDYPPFGAEIHEISPFGQCIIARGAINTKGPLRAMFNAFEAIIAVKGRLPVNIIFLIEGEEEIGSLTLIDYVKKNKEKFREADASWMAGARQDRNGKVRISLGNKGIITFDIICRGGDWGGPIGRNLHSSNEAWVESPVWKLIQCLASMRDETGKVLINGFYDGVTPPTSEEETIINELLKTFNEETLKEELSVKRFKYNLKGRELILQYLYQPTLNIMGIASGYVGPGTKTIIPHEARAKLDIRLHPDQDPEKIWKNIQNHLLEKNFRNVELKLHDASPGSKTSPNAPIVKAMLKTYDEYKIEKQIWPFSGGFAPTFIFTKVLGIPFISGGIGHGGRAHAPNEYIILNKTGPIYGISDMEKFYVKFLYNYAET